MLAGLNLIRLSLIFRTLLEDRVIRVDQKTLFLALRAFILERDVPFLKKMDRSHRGVVQGFNALVLWVRGEFWRDVIDNLQQVAGDVFREVYPLYFLYLIMCIQLGRSNNRHFGFENS